MPEKRKNDWMKAHPERAREIHRKWRATHIEEERTRKRKWKSDNPEKVRATRIAGRAGAVVSTKKWIESNPCKSSAHKILREAIRLGKIIRPPSCSWPGCEGTVGIHGHHEDYSKPLSVVWLCRKCHKNLHLGVESSGEKPCNTDFLRPEDTLKAFNLLPGEKQEKPRVVVKTDTSGLKLFFANDKLPYIFPPQMMEIVRALLVDLGVEVLEVKE